MYANDQTYFLQRLAKIDARVNYAFLLKENSKL